MRITYNWSWYCTAIDLFSLLDSEHDRRKFNHGEDKNMNAQLQITCRKKTIKIKVVKFSFQPVSKTFKLVPAPALGSDRQKGRRTNMSIPKLS